MSDNENKRINSDGNLELRDGSGNWVEVPASALARLTAVVNPAEASRLASGALPAPTAASVNYAADTRKRFQQVTGCDPADWLDKLRAGKILERSPRVETLYKTACELTGTAPSPFDLM